VLIWKELYHPNVLPLLGIDVKTKDPSCCLVSPWMSNRNVMAFLEKNPKFDKASLVSTNQYTLFSTAWPKKGRCIRFRILPMV
jgi:hypothetical protein